MLESQPVGRDCHSKDLQLEDSFYETWKGSFFKRWNRKKAQYSRCRASVLISSKWKYWVNGSVSYISIVPLERVVQNLSLFIQGTNLTLHHRAAYDSRFGIQKFRSTFHGVRTRPVPSRFRKWKTFKDVQTILQSGFKLSKMAKGIYSVLLRFKCFLTTIQNVSSHWINETRE